MKITELKQIGKSENYKVYLDGVYHLNLNLETIFKNKIKVGDEFNEEIEKMQFESEKQIAFEKCLKLLSNTIKSKKDVTDYLTKKGYSQKVIEYVLSKLEEYKYVDDLSYAEKYVFSQKSSKGKKMMEYTLKTKGISNEIIDRVLSGLEQKDELTNLAKKYLKNKEDNYQTKQKLFRYLASKGFEYDEISATITSITKKGDIQDDWN